MAEVNFSNLLDQKAGDVKRPPKKPPGTYHGVISGYKFDKSSQKQTPFVRFTLNSVTPGEDVDPSMLVDDEQKPIELAKWHPTVDFFITPDALWRLTEFMEGFKLQNFAGRSINEQLAELRGLPVDFTVVLKPTQDNTDFFNQVSSITASA